jgi:hypothetical protein
MFAAAVASLVLLATGCTASSLPQQGRTEVLVGALDYAFAVPESLRAGEVAFGLENRGTVPHELIVVGLHADADSDEIVRRDRADSTWSHLRDAPSGILTADSGVRTPGSLLVHLKRGKRYLLVCNFQDSAGAPTHMHLGMLKVVSVY